MNIIITGEQGIGKSTCCQKIAQMAISKGLSCGGIITTKSDQGDAVARDLMTDTSMLIASQQNVFQWPHHGRFYFNPEGMQFGLKAIESGLKAEVLFVDELGYLELRQQGFYPAIAWLADKPGGITLSVIRNNLLLQFLARLPAGPIIFEVTLDTRDSLPGRIFDLIENTLRKNPSDLHR